MVTLHNLYGAPGLWSIPYELLQQRAPHENISHKAMPTWQEHCEFVGSEPYLHWYCVRDQAGQEVGCVYLTRQREIGVGVLKRHRSKGLARQAIAELMRLHPGRFLANIAPANEASIALFRSLGFGGPVQITLEKL